MHPHLLDIADIIEAAAARADRRKARVRRVHPLVAAHPWSYEAYHDELKWVLPSVLQWASDVLYGDGEPYWLAILGPSGIGKTFALSQAVRFLDRHRDSWALRKTAHRTPTVVHLRPQDDLGDYKAPRDYAQRDLVYIEDIGAAQGMDRGPGAVLAGRVAELLQLRTRKWTALCANLHRQEIAERLDGRIASRLKRDGSILLEIPNSVPDFHE